NRALNLARPREALIAESRANLGLGRVLLRRGLWSEAATAHQELVTRLRAADDLEALATVYLGLGEAQRNLDSRDEAQRVYVEAARLFSEGAQPLGQAEALRGEAGLLLDAGEIEAAVGRYDKALELVEHVGEAVAEKPVRTGFFDVHAAIYG